MSTHPPDSTRPRRVRPQRRARRTFRQHAGAPSSTAAVVHTPARWQAALDAILRTMLARPAALIAAAISLTIAMLVVPPITARRVQRDVPPAATPAAPAAVAGASVADTQPLAVVGAYNAASIAAGATGDAGLVLPYFTDDSAERAAITAEFARRAEQDERHIARLVRWGLVEQSASQTTAVLTTQEVWDDTTYRRGAEVDVRIGTLGRFRYHLARPAAGTPWRIAAIDSVLVLP